jgi:hypothetical protein
MSNEFKIKKKLESIALLIESNLINVNEKILCTNFLVTKSKALTHIFLS